MSDLISRHAAIEAFEDTTFTKNEILRRLSELPSAQPVAKDTNVPSTDVISRQAAIDALWKVHQNRPLDSDRWVITDCLQEIDNLPSIEQERKIHFADADHVWIDGKQYISLGRFQEAVVEAQPERKKGKWIIEDNPGTGWYRVTCSECGDDVTSTAPCIGFYPNAKVTWDYCPNCGADMRKDGADDKT